MAHQKGNLLNIPKGEIKLLDTCNVTVGQIRNSTLLPPKQHVILKHNQHLMFEYLLVFKHKFGLRKMLSSVFTKLKNNENVSLKICKKGLQLL